MKRKDRKKKTPLAYKERVYRTLTQSGLISSYVKMAETDLHILAPLQVADQALTLVSRLRLEIESYISKNPSFVSSLVPLPVDKEAPPIVLEMMKAGRIAGVGPMAAVAGAIAESVGMGLHRSGVEELIVENGGDIFLLRKQQCTVAVFAGESPLSNRVGIRLQEDRMPCGVCCSSGTVGHSLSFGTADAVVVVASSTSVADAAATRIGNEVKNGADGIEKALRVAGKIDGISGVLIVQDEKLGAWGSIELEQL